MSTYIHRAIIVTGFVDKEIEKAHNATYRILKDKDIDDENLPGLLTQITPGQCNNYRSFFIAPDGFSFFGEASAYLAAIRTEIKNALNSFDVEWVEIQFGKESTKPATIIDHSR
uniref:hypothetical protein n=1 Tax=Pedobacter schmidteae TaxID=2201271 RepID=UPI000EAE2352|nr:hypothetical protein [Pedobacter schmidteae]